MATISIADSSVGIENHRKINLEIDLKRNIDICTAQIAIDHGNLDIAELWAQQRDLQADEPFSLFYAMECLTQARYFYAKKQYLETIRVLKTLRFRCLKRKLTELTLQIDILHCAALEAMKHYKEAASILKKALVLAEAERLIRPFVNDSELISPILRRIAHELPSRISSAYLDKIFAACDIFLCDHKVSQILKSSEHDELTKREAEILIWMAMGYRNKEIAQKACIAITTVKTHVSNILVKLGVESRTQAVLKAKEINIL